MLLSILWYSLEHTRATYVRGSFPLLRTCDVKLNLSDGTIIANGSVLVFLCFCHIEPVRQFFFKQKEVGEMRPVILN